MIRVHLTHEISMSPCTLDGDGWITTDGFLDVTRELEALATFTPGAWTYVEDLSMTDPKSDGAA